jgi:hypothetical protein
MAFEDIHNLFTRMSAPILAFGFLLKKLFNRQRLSGGRLPSPGEPVCNCLRPQTQEPCAKPVTFGTDLNARQDPHKEVTVRKPMVLERLHVSVAYRLPVRSGSRGAGDETRTRDIFLGKEVLYQLSYARASIN